MLRQNVPLLGGLVEPLCSFVEVLGQTSSSRVQEAQVVLCLGVTLFCFRTLATRRGILSLWRDVDALYLSDLVLPPLSCQSLIFKVLILPALGNANYLVRRPRGVVPAAPWRRKFSALS